MQCATTSSGTHDQMLSLHDIVLIIQVVFGGLR